MADHDYSFLGALTLDAGSWADWFSGAGSFAAVVVALYGYRIVHSQRKQDERDRERRLAEAIEWKLLQAYNDTATVAKHLKSSLSDDTDVAKQPYKFFRVRPLGIPPKIDASLTSDEVSFLMKARAASVLMELADTIERYRSIEYAAQEYRKRHEALYDLMPPPVSGDGTLFTHQLTPEEFKRVRPHAQMIESLLDALVELVAEGVEKGNTLLADYEAAMTAYFGKWHLETGGNLEQADLTVFRSMPLQKP